MSSYGRRELGEDRAEIVHVDRLHEVRVEAGGLRALPIDGLTVAADGDEPELGAACRRPQSTGDLEAVDPGQAEIDEGDREVAGLRVVQTILAAARGHHLVAVQ